MKIDPKILALEDQGICMRRVDKIVKIEVETKKRENWKAFGCGRMWEDMGGCGTILFFYFES